MYKVAILGCENSHANLFLNYVKDTKYKELVEFIGVYSDDKEASTKISEEFGVYSADRYDEFVGKVDAIVITARHGDNHYKYAKPYLKSGIPMFIDKPITCTESDAKQFMEELVENKVKVCGGSMCIFAEHVQNLKRIVQNESNGKVLGGFLRAPLVADSPHGGFYFYAQHLVQIMMEIFGNYPESVIATNNDKHIDCIVKYADKNVHLNFADNVWNYYASVSSEEKVEGDMFESKGFPDEFEEFYNLISEGKQPQSYVDFFAPVYILNAIDRSMTNGREETINRYNNI